MFRTTTRASAGVTTRTLIGAGAGALTGALVLALLAGTGAVRAAAPKLAAEIVDGTLQITGASGPERIALRLSALELGSAPHRRRRRRVGGAFLRRRDVPRNRGGRGERG